MPGLVPGIHVLRAWKAWMAGTSPAMTTCRSRCDQNNPTILPSAPTSMLSADGTFGRPGMVMISPQIATMNSAPADSRTSRTGIEKPVGAPLASGLVENEYWVLAMQTGNLPKPISSQVLSWSLTDL